MSDAARLRDSTQIVLPREALDGLQSDLEAQFTLTIVEAGRLLRIVGSPVEIKGASDFLARNGVSLP